MSRTTAVRKPTAAPAAAFPFPALKKGETYIGAIIGADGKGHHVVLLPGDERMTWNAAMAWAKKQGGDLPDRVEQALFHRDHKARFQETWYWSNTSYAGYADFAWFQSFDYGYQYYDH